MKVFQKVVSLFYCGTQGFLHPGYLFLLLCDPLSICDSGIWQFWSGHERFLQVLVLLADFCISHIYMDIPFDCGANHYVPWCLVILSYCSWPEISKHICHLLQLLLQAFVFSFQLVALFSKHTNLQLLLFKPLLEVTRWMKLYSCSVPQVYILSTLEISWFDGLSLSG